MGFNAPSAAQGHPRIIKFSQQAKVQNSSHNKYYINAFSSQTTKHKDKTKHRYTNTKLIFEDLVSSLLPVLKEQIGLRLTDSMDRSVEFIDTRLKENY